MVDMLFGLLPLPIEGTADFETCIAVHAGVSPFVGSSIRRSSCRALIVRGVNCLRCSVAKTSKLSGSDAVAGLLRTVNALRRPPETLA